ncbi:hypothetical protein ANCCAN_30510 [Ancylostoma caninum]|uniref:Uncharacterized protein n=1 Tax=Ancylostoma caninum TaxID=29170 RepID=A0A368EVW4_ANCCA|nr:hypothetical protein ANCCAN_30510 [Ancylostoma caninum]
MCDQNALLRLLAAQATAQQQMLFGCGTGTGAPSAGGGTTAAAHRGASANGAAAAALLNGMLGVANPFLSPEMMLWQSMVAAQAQIAQLQQQQQAQNQPSFDDVLKKLAESAKKS